MLLQKHIRYFFFIVLLPFVFTPQTIWGQISNLDELRAGKETANGDYVNFPPGDLFWRFIPIGKMEQLDEGWKIHISLPSLADFSGAAIGVAEQKLVNIHNYLAERKINHKFVLPATYSRAIGAEPHQAGKFITVYPDDKEELVSLAADLYEKFRDDDGFGWDDFRNGGPPVHDTPPGDLTFPGIENYPMTFRYGEIGKGYILMDRTEGKDSGFKRRLTENLTQSNPDLITQIEGTEMYKVKGSFFRENEIPFPIWKRGEL